MIKVILLIYKCFPKLSSAQSVLTRTESGVYYFGAIAQASPYYFLGFRIEIAGAMRYSFRKKKEGKLCEKIIN